MKVGVAVAVGVLVGQAHIAGVLVPPSFHAVIIEQVGFAAHTDATGAYP